MSKTDFPPASFTPTMLGYTGQGAFRYWCQTALPLVYDDTLSYYELLNKVVNYLNNVIADVSNTETNVENLLNAYNQLQDYVNTYFTGIDIQEEINTKLDEMASSGELSEIISPFIPDIVTTWLNDHVTPTSPVVDNTLTIRGAAADAKSTGDELKKRFDLSVDSSNLFVENDDLNNLTDPGSWITPTSAIANSLVNAPFTNVSRLYVGRISRVSGVVYQIVISNDGGFAIRSYSGNYWSNWNILNTKFDLDISSANLFSENDNLNSFTNVGSWITPTSAIANSLVNAPFTNVSRLYVGRISRVSGVVYQIVISNVGGFAIRSYSGNFWSNWDILNTKFDLDISSANLFVENDDLNNLTNPGSWITPTSAIANSLVNAPFTQVSRLYVGRLSRVAGVVYQLVISNIGGFAVRSYSGNAWSNWCILNIKFDLDISSANLFSENDDLNNLTNPGSWITPTSAIANSLVNAPFTQVSRLYVGRLSRVVGVVYQLVISNIGGFAIRSYSGNAWSNWSILNEEEKETRIAHGAEVWTFRGELTKTGFVENTGNFYASDFVDITDYTILRLNNCVSSAEKNIAYFYNDDRVLINIAPVALSHATYSNYLIKKPENAKYIRCMVRSRYQPSVNIYAITYRANITPSSYGIDTVENIISNFEITSKNGFDSVKTNHQPIFVLIDDDTRSVNQVEDFMKICDDNSIPGTSAAITTFLMNDDNLVTALKNGEKRGHQTVFHCHEQAGNTIWTNADDYVEEVTENVAQGIQEMESFHFCNWRDWVTPAGTTKETIVKLARRFGLRSITSITQNAFLGYDNSWNRWRIPRMELYPDDVGHASGQTLQGIKDKIDECVSANGLLLVGIHCYQDADYGTAYEGSKGWNNSDYGTNGNEHYNGGNQTRFEERFSRIYEMISYAKEKSMTFMTLSEALSYWEPVFNLYEMF